MFANRGALVTSFLLCIPSIYPSEDVEQYNKGRGTLSFRANSFSFLSFDIMLTALLSFCFVFCQLHTS